MKEKIVNFVANSLPIATLIVLWINLLFFALMFPILIYLCIWGG